MRIVSVRSGETVSRIHSWVIRYSCWQKKPFRARREGQAISTQKRDIAETDNLAEAVAAGDRDAEAQIVSRYGEGLWYLIRREIDSPDDARDIYQETFRVVIERLRGDGIHSPESLPSFIVGVSRRLMMAYWRGRDRMVRSLETMEIPEANESASSPFEQVARAEEIARLKDAVARLHVPRDREILRRVLLDEDKHEICDALGIKADHFKKVMYRARVRLRAILAGTQCL